MNVATSWLTARLSGLVMAAAALVPLAATGCAKDEPPAPTIAPSATAPLGSVALPAFDAGATSVPEAAAAPVTSASAVPAPSAMVVSPDGGSKAGAACGDKPLPPCPLAAWMKANTSPAMSAQDFDALAKALEKIATFAPAGYPNWVSISRDGADAARAQTLDGVKASCRGCHNQYKDRYRKEMRSRPI